MTDEQANNNTTEPKDEGRPEPISVEEYQAEVQRLRADLTKVREEAASRRVALRDAQEELTRVRDDLSKAKTVEEYNKLAEEYEAAKRAHAHEALVGQYASVLPEQLRKSVNWPESEDAIKALAAELSQFSAPAAERSPSGGLGPRNDSGSEVFDPATLGAHYKR